MGGSCSCLSWATEAAIFWKFDWGWRICFHGTSLTWLLARSLSSSLRAPLCRAAGVCSWHGSCLPPEQAIQQWDHEGSLMTFKIWSWKLHAVTSTYFVKSGSLSSAHSKGGGSRVHVLRGGSKLRAYFRPLHPFKRKQENSKSWGCKNSYCIKSRGFGIKKRPGLRGMASLFSNSSIHSFV